MSDFKHRRLAAIVSCDVVGYSRLMGNDETGTLASFRTHRSELVEPKLAEFEGRIVKSLGDGFLIEFPSVVNAVRWAIEVQRGMAVRNGDVAAERRITFRIGINLGDIIFDGDGDIHGDSVNIAARLEALASPGGITMSNRAFEEIRDRLDASFTDTGEHELKNISRPVRVWAWGSDATVGQLGGKRSGKGARQPAVAVMPFKNLASDPDQEYFSDGLTEDIITALSHYRTFPVISRNSTFAYKGRSQDVGTLADELGARYILEGSVRKSGSRIRISTQLTDGPSGVTVWAERFDRDLTDIFDLQDEIVLRIAATVEPEMHRAERSRSAKSETTNLDVWDYYHRGWAKLFEFTKDGNRSARDFFNKALEEDPDYRPAYTGIAYSYHRDLTAEFGEDRKNDIEKCLAAARRGVALDPVNSNARVAPAQAYMWPDQQDLALAEAEKAIELNPNNAWALTVLGTLLDSTGDTERGIQRMQKALELNPQDPRNHVSFTLLARAHFNARSYEAAMDWAKRALRHQPDYPNANYLIAASLSRLGRMPEARAALDACERAQPGFVAKRATWKPYTDSASNLHILDAIRTIGAGA